MTRLIVLGLALLCGCSHAYISQSDSESVTACCPSQNIICTESKLKDLAAESCGGTVSLDATGTRGTGNVSVQRNFMNGDILGVSEDKEKCELFKCDRGPAPAAIR